MLVNSFFPERKIKICLLTFNVVFFIFGSDSSADVKFQFFGSKQDGYRVHETFKKMVDRGRLGNVSFDPSSLAFREEAVLQIEVSASNFSQFIFIFTEMIFSSDSFYNSRKCQININI